MCWGCAGGLCHFFVFSLICRRHFKKEVKCRMGYGGLGVGSLAWVARMRFPGVWTAEREHHGVLVLGGLSLCFLLFCFACFCAALVCLSLSSSLSA